MDILETISRRVSIRNYRPEPASAEDLEEVRRAGEQAETLTRAEMTFHLCSHDEMGGEVRGILGDYGKYIQAPHYIVLGSREVEGYLVDAGFRFEQMILQATRKDLGTCWVGGSFREVSLRPALGLDTSWRILALTPVGRVADPGLLHRAVRGVVGSSRRRPIEELFFWKRHGTPLPEKVVTDKRLSHLLEATRWAPSWANKQPWRFVLTGREILLYKQMCQFKEEKDYHLVDGGIAMAHVHLAATALGIGGQWQLTAFDVPGAPDGQPIGKYPLEVSF
jgi:nitroreductase